VQLDGVADDVEASTVVDMPEGDGEGVIGGQPSVELTGRRNDVGRDGKRGKRLRRTPRS
jgi:hypothetical protein